MSKFIIVDWEDGTSEYYKEDEVVVKDGNTVLKQFGKKMFEGRIVSFHNTKSSAKQELAERTEAPQDVAAVSEKAGKRERRMTSKMEELSSIESSKEVTRSSVKSVAKGTVHLNEKRKGKNKQEKMPLADNSQKLPVLDKPKKKKNMDAAVKKATERKNKDLSHVADILMSSVMEESDNSSTQEKTDMIPSLPTEAGTLTSTWNRQTTCTSDSANTTLQTTSDVYTLQTTSTNDTHQTTSASAFTKHTTSTWTPHSTSTWTPRSTSTWTPHSTSTWTPHSTSTWTPPHSTSTWTPPHSTSTFQSPVASSWMSQNSFVQQQDDMYPSRSLIGEAVAVSMDIDKPSLDTYQMSCKTCEQLRTTVECLHRQLFELQQTSAAFNSRLFQVEQIVTQMQSFPAQRNVSNISGQQVLNDPPPISAEIAADTLYNGFTKAQLEHDLPGKGWKSDAKWLLRRMFTLVELKGHSITGHHGSSKKTGYVRPPLEDRNKLRVLYDIIMEKYPGRLITDINLVLADVVKPSAAGMSE